MPVHLRQICLATGKGGLVALRIRHADAASVLRRAGETGIRTGPRSLGIAGTEVALAG